MLMHMVTAAASVPYAYWRLRIGCMLCLQWQQYTSAPTSQSLC